MLNETYLVLFGKFSARDIGLLQLHELYILYHCTLSIQCQGCWFITAIITRRQFSARDMLVYYSYILYIIARIFMQYTLSNSLDARDNVDYNESHVILSRPSKRDDQGQYKVPFGIHLPSCLHCIVYDSNTVSVMEDSE